MRNDLEPHCNALQFEILRTGIVFTGHRCEARQMLGEERRAEIFALFSL